MNYKPSIELLAPAGNVEAFLGAVNAGADAVYLGGSRFGARAYADNFTDDELVWCIRYAHLFGRKVYLTVNTLVKECEFDGISEFITPLYEAGLDGVIVQDIGVLAFMRDNYPGLELHASTQMTITSVYGAKMAKELGVCRVVPARELSLNEIQYIHDNTDLEIECFIHGAMCYCYSGQCLFSSILGGRSGNRGRCAQPCRLPYEASLNGRKSEKCYPLSLKDMCTIEILPDLIEAGIYSFKIEGRMKKPEYAAGVTAIYRKYIDIYLADREAYVSKTRKWTVEPQDMLALSKLYIRSEIQTGYYYRHNGRDMVTFESPSYCGSDDVLLQDIRKRYLESGIKYPLTANAVFIKGKPASLTFSCACGVSVISATVRGDIAEPAVRQPVTEENIRKQLGKLGDTSFVIDDWNVVCDEDIFYPLGKLNELRRQAVSMLEDAIIDYMTDGLHKSRSAAEQEHHVVYTQNYSPEMLNDGSASQDGFNLSVRTSGQLSAISDCLNAESPAFSCTALYIDSDILVCDTEHTLNICRKLHETGIKIYISLPYIIRLRDASFLEKLYCLLDVNRDIFYGIQVRSIDGMGYLQEKKYDGYVCADAGFYIWNRRAGALWQRYIKSFCMPYELKTSEQRDICGIMPCEKIIYGRIPMMLSAGCIAGTAFKCLDGKGGTAYLKDRYNKEFPVEINCRHCMNIIYNSVPLSLHSDAVKLTKGMTPRLDFTVENERETKAVISFFETVFSNGAGAVLPYSDYTTGHEKRGVE